MISEYYQVIQDLARYEYGGGFYTQPTNDSQVFLVEDLQFRIKQKFPDLNSAKAALKKVKKTNERIL